MIKMLFITDIMKLVKLGIASAYLSDEINQLNLMLLANPEAGKTSILMNFDFKRLRKNIFVFTDLTKSKMEQFLKAIDNPKKNGLKYVIIPDFTRITNHQKSTERGIVGLLNSGLEEGIREITSYITSGIIETKVLKNPVRFGMATSMTKQTIGDRRRAKYWYSIGFLSRFLPVSFSYSKDQVKEIRKHIMQGKDIMEKPEVLKLKPSKVKCSYKLLNMLEPYIDQLSEAQMLYGFRYTRQFRIMLKANALLRGKKSVTRRDVEDVEKLLRYINLDYNQVK